MNIDAIAKELKTSPSTVSRALRNCNGVNEKTRRRIVDFANKVGYVVPKAEKPHNVAVILPGETVDDAHELASRYMITIGHELTKLNWHMHVVPVHIHSQEILNNKETWPKTLLNNSIDCCIIIDMLPKKARRIIAEHFDRKVVMVARHYLEDGVSGVAISNYGSGSHAAEKVLEHGHKSIGWIGSQGSEDISRQRYFGMQSVLMENELKLDYEMWLDERKLIDADLEKQIDRMLKSSKKQPTAWIASNDWLAANFIIKMEQKGFRCPQDFELICFDNTKISEMFVQRKLSTIVSPFTSLAKDSVKLLKELLETKNTEPVGWLKAVEFESGDTFIDNN